jgi:glycolate oxidase iron-sulfur subunit
VHCGFCLPACPTYEVTADEADSPRGRIVLMQALARGEMAAADDGLQRHLDRCLACRGCESVCPSGVLFGPALEAARAEIAQARPLPLALRAALWVLARPERQRLLWLVSRVLRRTGLPARIARGAGREAPVLIRMMGMLAATSGSREWGVGSSVHTKASSAHQGSHSPLPTPPAALVRGCVMQGLFSHVHQATIECCRANGISVQEVEGQVCCGALAAHAGAHDFAADLARENVRAFATTDGPILVNSAGCGAMMKSYGDLLAGEPLEADARRVAARVRDVSEVLVDRGPKTGNRLPLRVAYDAPCHLLHAQKISAAPLALLAAIPGLEIVPLDGSERCCGAAGLYALIEPAMSQEVLASKLDATRSAAPDIVATGNPGCLMHIGAGLLLDGQNAVARHPVELLAWSYRA